MADNYRVTITVEGRDRASGVMQNLNAELARTEQAGAGAAGGLGGVTRQGQGLLGALGGVSGVVTAAAGAFAAWKIADKVGELRELGAEAQAAENTFVQLSGGAEAAARNLDLLRAATRGVVDDQSLMSGANRLLLMGLAETGDEAARLTGIAVTLGRAMGSDAATSVQDFAALLANKSIPRLDNFGIASARVRERVEELTATLGADEAFKVAVLEEGTAAMERLGGAAGQNATAWERVSARIQNAIQDVGQYVAGVLDGVAQMVDTAAAGIDTLREANETARAEVEETIATAQSLGGELAQSFTGVFTSEMFPDAESFFFVLTDAAGLFEQATGQTVDTVDELNQALARVGFPAVADGELAAAQHFLESAAGATDQLAQNQRIIDRDAQNLVNRYQAMAAAQERAARAAEGQARSLSEQAQQARDHRAEREMYEAMLQQRAGAQQAAEAMERLAEITAEVNTLTAGHQGYYSGDDVRLIGLYADEATRLQETIEGVSDLGYIDEGMVGEAAAFADEIGRVAERASASAESFADISGTLEGIFGLTQGGLGGEIMDAIADQMDAMGMSDAQIAAFERAGSLATGQETDASLAFQEQIVPLLAQLTPDLAAAATTALAGYMQEMRASGEQITYEGMARFLEENQFIRSSQGMGGGGAGLTGGQTVMVNPGDTVWGLSRQYGMSQEDFMAALGIANPYALQTGAYTFGGAPEGPTVAAGVAPSWAYTMTGEPGIGGVAGAETGAADFASAYATVRGDTTQIAADTTTWRDAFQVVRDGAPVLAEDLTGVRDEVEGIRGDLEGLAETAFRVALEIAPRLVGADADLARALISGGGLAGLIAQVVQGNGGTVPGTTPGGSQAYSTVRQ